MSPFLLPSDDSSPELAASEPCPKALIPPERQLEEGQQAHRLLTEMQALSSRIAAVNEITTAINRSLNLDEILRVVGKQAKWLLDFEHCSVCLRTNDTWQAITLFGSAAELALADMTPTQPLGRALQTGQAQVMQDGSSGFLQGYGSQIIVPLESDRQILGTLNFAISSAQAYSQEDLRISYLLALQVASAIRNANRFQEVNALLQELNWLYAQLDAEKRKSENLLLNTLPISIAEELKHTGKVEPIYYESASVMFADFKGFTQLAQQLSPRALVDELDYCFSHFDQIIEKHKLEKLKTIGDCYMCAGGIPQPNQTHAIDAVLAALEMQTFMQQRRQQQLNSNQPTWELRIGIHSGALVAGVIGQKKFAYDIWGDTVNTAAAMETSGIPGEINLSRSTRDRIQEFFACDYRGKLVAKNQGEVEMYLVSGIHSNLAIAPLNLTPNQEFQRLYRAVEAGDTSTPTHPLQSGLMPLAS